MAVKPVLSTSFADLALEEKAQLATSKRPGKGGKKVIGGASITKPDGRARFIEFYDDGTDETVDETGAAAAWDLD